MKYDAVAVIREEVERCTQQIKEAESKIEELRQSAFRTVLMMGINGFDVRPILPLAQNEIQQEVVKIKGAMQKIANYQDFLERMNDPEIVKLIEGTAKECEKMGQVPYSDFADEPF